jgi:hypothetical protein
MTAADDEARATARRLEQQHPGWMIIYGVYTRRFVAFPLFRVRQRVVVTAAYPDALPARLDAAEARLRIPGPREAGSGSDLPGG